ncbi:hypothetical protein CDL15_Pgr020506 [Punica granatum]|uniref:Pentatricopeptide repeat-containing protein At5g39350 n=1 Tax=Punica granatum TaxID=22663 RepID=A0A218VW98_PUNGR|nr:hypothetical protein CDL15_Pgr020506 [Punica granatum]
MVQSPAAVAKAKRLLSPFESLLRQCKESRSLRKTERVHARVITSGILSAPDAARLRSHLTAAYALCGHAPIARKLFGELPDRSSFLLNAVIRSYLLQGLYLDALNLFAGMLPSDQCRPDKFTYTLAFKACGELSFLDTGFVFHGKLFAVGLDSDAYIQNSLLAMYMNCREPDAAEKVFNQMLERTVVSWNTMITGYFKNACADQSVRAFKLMVDAGFEPDSATAVSVLPACGYLKELDLGRFVHKLVEEKGLGRNISVSNALVDMYAKCGKMNEAWSIIERMGERDVVTWTTVINGCILNDDVGRALEMCHLLRFDGVKPNSVTVASLLSACARLSVLRHGRCLHGWSVRQNLESNVMVETALIDMYAKCKRVDLSFRVLEKTSKNRTVPWNAIISGLVHNGLAEEAIKTFKEMLEQEVERNHGTLNGLLPAYAILADFQQAVNMHSYLTRTGLVLQVEITTGLIDVYSKSGGLESAHKLFNGIPNREKDIIVWSAIIAGYGMHGQGETAVSLFNAMAESGVEPNEVTFTSVLHACSHSGLVDEGLSLFRAMLQHHGRRLKQDHYTCIVDLLGRAGRLKEAYDLVMEMPYEPSHAVWGALLGACVIHENVDLGGVAAKKLFELEPANTGNYVLLAKIYSATGRWKDAENTRNIMKQIGLRKTPAHSLI